MKKFWLLLFELIYYLENVKKTGFKKLNPDLIVAYFDREQPGNRKIHTKTHNLYPKLIVKNLRKHNKIRQNQNDRVELSKPGVL